MKYLACAVFAFTCLACNSERKPGSSARAEASTEKPTNASEDTVEAELAAAGPAISAEDRAEIQSLIRQVLIWGDTPNFDELPFLIRNDTVIGFDLVMLKQNLDVLRKTDFFTEEFVENYRRIIVELDRQISANEIEPFVLDGYPPFSFSSDVDPWCLCQDYLDWNEVTIEPVRLDAEKGEMNWKWGWKSGMDPSWSDFAYPFRVAKVENKWKISYLTGFDYEKAVVNLE